jgi:hypothetical protein
MVWLSAEVKESLVMYLYHSPHPLGHRGLLQGEIYRLTFIVAYVTNALTNIYTPRISNAMSTTS